MRYPSDKVGPQTQTELLAMLFTMLGNAYNVLAQYEREEYEGERRSRMDRLNDAVRRGREGGHAKRDESAEAGGEFDATAT
jgi:hypothetical protein